MYAEKHALYKASLVFPTFSAYVFGKPAIYPSIIASVTSAIVKSAMVIGYSTAPKQLWPVIIGAHGKGMLFHGGGGMRGGTMSSTAATMDCTIPMPMPRPCMPKAKGGP